MFRGYHLVQKSICSVGTLRHWAWSLTTQNNNNNIKDKYTHYLNSPTPRYPSFLNTLPGNAFLWGWVVPSVWIHITIMPLLGTTAGEAQCLQWASFDLAVSSTCRLLCQENNWREEQGRQEAAYQSPSHSRDRGTSLELEQFGRSRQENHKLSLVSALQ